MASDLCDAADIGITIAFAHGDLEEEAYDWATSPWADPLVLPPPVLPLGDVDGCKLLQPEILHHVAMCLEPRELCRMDAATSGCQRCAEVEMEIWARLCALHFPTMYESVLNDIECGRAHEDGNVVSAPLTCAPKSRRGMKPSVSGSSSTGSRGGARQSRAWRRQKPRRRTSETTGDDDIVDGRTPSASASVEASPDLYPWNSPGLSSAASPSLSPMSALNVSPHLSAGTSPTLSVESPARSSVAEASPLSKPVDVPLLMQADWRALYARRLRKKLQWEAGKKSGHECHSSHITEDSGPLKARSPKADSKRLSVSALTVREIGCLSDAAYRLKVCSQCGEKFSPGESRSQQTSCCFHPGDFSPAHTRGWHHKELKQLRLCARQALRSAGGATWVQRHPRGSRGHGHWMKGLGVFASDMQKVRQCLEGEVSVIWSCCGASELFAEGCQRGMHRHFH